MTDLTLWAFLGFVLIQIVLIAIYLLRIERVGPDEALIVYGRGPRPPVAEDEELFAVFRDAVRYFLSKSEGEQANIVLEVLEGELRRLLEKTTVEELQRSPTRFADALLEQGRPRIEEMGIDILSLIIREIRVVDASSVAVETTAVP